MASDISNKDQTLRAYWVRMDDAHGAALGTVGAELVNDLTGDLTLEWSGLLHDGADDV